MMNIVASLVVGVVVGWLASVFMGTDGREGLIRNVTAGVAGAYVGGWVLRSLLGYPSQAGISLSAMIAASLGAATLLLVVKRFN